MAAMWFLAMRRYPAALAQQPKQAPPQAKPISSLPDWPEKPAFFVYSLIFCRL